MTSALMKLSCRLFLAFLFYFFCWEQRLSQSVNLFFVLIPLRVPSPLSSPPLGFLQNMHSSSNFPPPRLSASFHSSLSLSAYLTTMATGDVAALTGMRLIENNSVRRVGHARKSPHVCAVAGPPSLIDTIPWANTAVKGGTGGNVWTWEWKKKKTERCGGETAGCNDGDVDGEPCVTMELN